MAQIPDHMCPDPSLIPDRARSAIFAGLAVASMPGRRLRGSSNALDGLLHGSLRASSEAGGSTADLSHGASLAHSPSAPGSLRPPSPPPSAVAAARAVGADPTIKLPARPTQSAFAGAASTWSLRCLGPSPVTVPWQLSGVVFVVSPSFDAHAYEQMGQWPSHRSLISPRHA